MSASIADPEACADLSDDDSAQKRALALVVWTIQGRWERVEDGCLSLLATARKRRQEA
jgi:hypothetical protein